MLAQPLLYELVGLGMASFTRIANRATSFGMDEFVLAPGTVTLVTHLSDADVPLFAGRMWADSGMWRQPARQRPAFAVRNDMLLPGFLAGYPPGLPLALRRALWRLDIGTVMRERVRCLPVLFSERTLLVEALRPLPQLALDGSLPDRPLALLRARAAALGRRPPRLAREVLDGAYADVLWQRLSAEEWAVPAFAELRAARLAESSAALLALMRHVRGGGSLILFPHGMPSPDGGVNPLDPRAGGLLQRLRPTSVQPVGLAYDPLRRGRTRAYAGVGAPLAPPPRRGGEPALLAALRLATPLVCGLVVARLTAERGAVPSADAAGAAVDAAVEQALAQGRRVDPALRRGARARAELVAETVAVARERGAADPQLRRAARLWTTVEPPEPAVRQPAVT